MALDMEGFDEFSNFEMDENLVNELRMDEDFGIPWQMTDFDVWNNYCDQRLYELDKLVREYLQSTSYYRSVKKGKMMRTAVPLLFVHLFGRPPTNKESQICVILHTLMKYYCTKYTGSTFLNNKRFSRVYYFSRYACRYRKPYSIRLRLELNNEQPFRSYDNRTDKTPEARRRNREALANENGAGSQDSGGASSEGGVPELREECSTAPSEQDVH